MPCIERFGLGRVAAACCVALAACSAPSSQAPEAAPAPEARSPRAGAEAPRAAAHALPSAIAKSDSVRLAAPLTQRNWTEVRRQAAHRLVAANPTITYLGKVPDQLLAIPVLEVELNRDGSVRRIVTLREPRQAKDTLRIATDAIHRAAPFGDVSHLPRPWKFVETFLFDDDRKFKPRMLDD